ALEDASTGAPLSSAETDRLLEILSPHQAGTLDCVRGEPSQELVITIDAHGVLTDLSVGGASDRALQCLARELSGARVPDQASPRRVRWFVAYGLRAALATAPPLARRQVQALLASRSSEILACVGAAMIGVRSSWDASGSLAVTVVGPLS